MATKTGQRFETEIEGFLRAELKRGRLGLNKKHAKVFRNKGYHSSLRGKPIVVDVSLELTRPGASEPYFIWIFECKDYGNRVPVGDVEVFHAKLEQLGMHRIKGTIACRNGFQRGAVDAARGWGIGLLRMCPAGSVIRLSEVVRAVSAELTVFGLTERDTANLESTFHGMTADGSTVSGMQELIRHEVSSGRGQ